MRAIKQAIEKRFLSVDILQIISVSSTIGSLSTEFPVFNPVDARLKSMISRLGTQENCNGFAEEVSSLPTLLSIAFTNLRV
jgi:hypothetical protein